MNSSRQPREVGRVWWFCLKADLHVKRCEHLEQSGASLRGLVVCSHPGRRTAISGIEGWSWAGGSGREGGGVSQADTPGSLVKGLRGGEGGRDTERCTDGKKTSLEGTESCKNPSSCVELSRGQCYYYIFYSIFAFIGKHSEVTFYILCNGEKEKYR